MLLVRNQNILKKLQNPAGRPDFAIFSARPLFHLGGRNDVTRYANFGAVSQPEKIENLTLTRYANFGAAGCSSSATTSG